MGELVLDDEDAIEASEMVTSFGGGDGWNTVVASRVGW